MSEAEVTKIVLENIQTKLSSQIFDGYFRDIVILSIEDNVATIACKNAFTKQTIENRYHTTLVNSIRSATSNNQLEANLIIKNLRSRDTALSQKNLFSGTIPMIKNTSSAPQQSSQSGNNQVQTTNQFQPSQSFQKPAFESYLNPKYRFGSFIVGSGNQLAHAAAIAIANNPGNAYNPFFIYGNVGLGKTHLMQAIGNQVLDDNPNAKVLYCTTETFLNEMVSSIRTQKTAAFREKYRAMDILILDDIQFLSNKEMLQEEFFNTFNTLYQSGKQIIIASDRPPFEIAHLEDRIRSRFEGGLVADVKSPNVETRIAILQNKLIERNEFLPETAVSTIAESVDTNIRELEGALLKISIFYKTTGNITANDVRTLLGDKIIIRKKKINPLEIMQTVCDHLQVEIKEVKSTKRNYDIAYARQLCMYLLKDILKLQLIKIAKHVGRKDHTTVMHGITKIEKMIESDNETARMVSELKAKINA